MLKIFSILRNFFSSLFSANKEDSQRRRQLRKIQQELSHHRQHFFKPQSNEILPAFAKTLHKFSTYARVLQELFERTILHGNSRTADMFKDYLVESKLDQSVRSQKAEFGYSVMQERLQNSGSFKKELHTILKEFETYLGFFRQPEFKNFDREFTQLERLAMLTRHDFEKLLSFFDPEIRLNKPSYQPNFAPAHARHLTQDLMDFYFLIAELHIDHSVINNAALLYTRIRKESSPKDLGKLKHVIEQVDGMLKEFLPPGIILALLRAANDDPTLVIPADTEIQTYLELYKSRLLSRFELDREKLIREHSEAAVTHSLQTLFGTTELEPVTGLPQDVNQALANADFPGFTSIKPFGILKTFCLRHFEPKIKVHCNEFLFNAFFEDKMFKDKFIGLYHELLEASDRIAGFESSLLEPTEVSVLTIKTYLEKHAGGKQIDASLINLVDTINRNTAGLIETLANAFAEFNKAFTLLLQDSRQHSPLLVSNFRTIGGETRNQEVLANLATDCENIDRFVEIMKHFTIIQKHFERDQTSGLKSKHEEAE